MHLNPVSSIPIQIAEDQRDRWTLLVKGQHGVLSLYQLKGLGVTKASIQAHLRARRWQRMLPRVYATFTGPPSREARLQAAVLYGGPSAMLSHRTAAEEWGMLSIDDSAPVHVTVPYTCSAVSQPPLVMVHRSRAHEYLWVDADPPRTAQHDTAIDLAMSEPLARDAADVLAALANKSGLSVGQLMDRVGKRRPARHAKTIEQTLVAMAGGVQSALELRYATTVEGEHGLPAARRQSPVSVDGLTLYEDCTYDHIGVALTVRLDGREHHSLPHVAFRDRRRDNVAELSGRARLTYGWQDIDRDPCGVSRELAAVLRREGWQGQTRTCPRCSSAVSA